MVERNRVYSLALSDREEEALGVLCKEQGMTCWTVLRQSLRLYQLVHERLKAGETFSFSGDAQRAKEFAGLADISKLDLDHILETPTS